jgi:hypothetical protein
MSIARPLAFRAGPARSADRQNGRRERQAVKLPATIGVHPAGVRNKRLTNSAAVAGGA